MIRIKKNNINLYDTITCGQIFRYKVLDNGYIIILSDRVVKLVEDGNYILIYSNNEINLEEIITRYLDLNTDYEYINKLLIKNDPSLKVIIDKCNGFKIVNSPYFETIISYMISANNNVRNIQNSLNLMSEKYGKSVIFEGNTYYLFPKLEDFKKLSIEDYKNLKLGFRCENIYNFIQKITNEDINNINNLSTEDALRYLTSYKGIGLKIASCILLFGYKRFDVFPIDTWVKKYMSETYNLSNTKKIEEYTRLNYGKYSGLVIQYMFHSKRNKD